MIKRTLYFGQPAYLSVQKSQLFIRYPDKAITRTVPIEDIGIVMLDHYRLTLTTALLNRLLANNTAVICCNASHLPLGMFLNLDGHSQQLIHWEAQIQARPGLKKRLWKQLMQAKIGNQARLLALQGENPLPLERWAKEVTNGDRENKEARAAAYYWPRLLGKYFPNFKRERFGDFPNPLFNFGYTLLRGVVARALVASGLLPTLGIHHHNKYNAYCLADDLMEPYRPFVDEVVLKLVDVGVEELNPQSKPELLKIPQLDVCINQQISPLMLAVQQTTASLQQCFAGNKPRLKLPGFV
ncbi:MAG: type II CRISPR-associated endonuclease Cas1 [Flavobacteriaceae bacterium]